jgi:hypothetical protein
MYRALLSFIVVGACLVTSPVLAQSLPSTDPLTLTIEPAYPRPYDQVTIIPDSTVVDLSASTVTVSVNGSVVHKGTGTGGVRFPVGGLGEKTTVLVSIASPGGLMYSQDLIIRPADVALVLEPTSTAHSFYRGLPMVAPNGGLRLVAMPDLRTSANTRLDPATLVYSWKFGDMLLQASSGIGRSVLVATAPPPFRDADIVLTVSSQDSTLVAQSKITIEPVRDPILRVYENDPLIGPFFDRALSGTYQMAETESTLRAVSYFFASAPTIEWRVNNKIQGSDKDLTVRSTGGAGSAQLSTSARLPAFQQSATNGFGVRFDGTRQGLGIFGL